jgi:hypothetical protein
MAQFTYYEVGSEELTALREQLGNSPDHRLRRDVDGARWLVRSSKTLKLEGARKVKPERWEAALAPRERAPVKGVAPELIARPWRVEPGARKGQLARRSLTPKRATLELTFGAGSGDAVTIVTDTALPPGVKRLQAELRVPAGIVVGVSPSLRSGRGRLRAVLESRTLSQAGRATLEWSLPELPAGERDAIAALAFTLSTEADSGSLFLDAITFGS